MSREVGKAEAVAYVRSVTEELLTVLDVLLDSDEWAEHEQTSDDPQYLMALRMAVLQMARVSLIMRVADEGAAHQPIMDIADEAAKEALNVGRLSWPVDLQLEVSSKELKS